MGNAVELADAEELRTTAEIELARGQFELARARAVARSIHCGGTVTESVAGRRARKLRISLIIVALAATALALGAGHDAARRGAREQGRARRRAAPGVGRDGARRDLPQAAPLRRHASPVGRGQRRPAVRLGLRRHRARAPGRARQARRGARDARLPQREHGERAPSRSQARAIEARQKAIADESQRQSKLLDGGFASANEVEQALAQSGGRGGAARGAEGARSPARRSRSSDCVLRAPFDGEVGDRFVDPGAFVRPGTAIVSVVDRSTVRFVADVPEVGLRRRRAEDAPCTSTSTRPASSSTAASRAARRTPTPTRAPFTSRSTSPTPVATIPVDTTGEVTIGFGAPIAVTAIPLYAATVAQRQSHRLQRRRATSRTRPAFVVLGEAGGTLFLEPTLAPGTRVVTEGRALLNDGDASPPASTNSPSSSSGNRRPRPRHSGGAR